MKHGLLGLLLASALAFPSWAEDAGKPPIVPVKREPFTYLVSRTRICHLKM
jgi:hypothetical protein